MLRDGLDRAIEVFEHNPDENGLDVLVELRSSFTVPMPGLVAERFGTGRVVVRASEVMARAGGRKMVKRVLRKGPGFEMGTFKMR